MKKRILLVGMIVAMGAVMFLNSCTKVELIGCSCTEVYGGYSDVYKYTLEEMKFDYSASTCGELERNINLLEYGNYANISCEGIY
jgi:hypothetical protein